MDCEESSPAVWHYDDSTREREFDNARKLGNCLNDRKTFFKKTYVLGCFLITGRDLWLDLGRNIPSRVNDEHREAWERDIKRETSWGYLLRESFSRAI